MGIAATAAPHPNPPRVEGYVHGRSDRVGAYPTDFPVTPGDLCATVYQLLGRDPHMMVPDQTGRPVHAAHGGEPIRAILA